MRYRLDGRLDRRSYKAIKRSNARRGIQTRRERGDRIGNARTRLMDEQGRLPCAVCKEWKLASAFCVDKSCACGRSQRCKPCDSKRVMARKRKRDAAAAKPPEVQVFALWYESNL